MCNCDEWPSGLCPRHRHDEWAAVDGWGEREIEEHSRNNELGRPDFLAPVLTPWGDQ